MTGARPESCSRRPACPMRSMPAWLCWPRPAMGSSPAIPATSGRYARRPEPGSWWFAADIRVDGSAVRPACAGAPGDLRRAHVVFGKVVAWARRWASFGRAGTGAGGFVADYGVGHSTGVTTGVGGPGFPMSVLGKVVSSGKEILGWGVTVLWPGIRPAARAGSAARRAGHDLDEHLRVGRHGGKRFPAGQRGSVDQAAGRVLLAVQA